MLVQVLGLQVCTRQDAGAVHRSRTRGFGEEVVQESRAGSGTHGGRWCGRQRGGNEEAKGTSGRLAEASGWVAGPDPPGNLSEPREEQGGLGEGPYETRIPFPAGRLWVPRVGVPQAAP